MKIGSDGREFIEINFNEKTKKNQGDDNFSANLALRNNHHIISAQDGFLCPVESFKKYVILLNHKCTAFFQYPTKDKCGYHFKLCCWQESFGRNDERNIQVSKTFESLHQPLHKEDDGHRNAQTRILSE